MLKKNIFKLERLCIFLKINYLKAYKLFPYFSLLILLRSILPPKAEQLSSKKKFLSILFSNYFCIIFVFNFKGPIIRYYNSKK